ncbi:MAG: BTAD domain-containing putative transcriptional regulator [Candidatus Longimicrobiales bacterium M2_2A_002]
MNELKLLGGAVLTGDAGATRLASRRHPMALLALLVTAPARTLSRGKLVGFLWPEVSERTARNRLTSAVYEIRSALGEDVLASVGSDLRLTGSTLVCDVLLFDDALAADDPEAAIRLYGGPFLDGFHLPDAAAFEQRVDRERDRLHREYLAALEALAGAAADRADAPAAARWWRRRVEETPHDTRVTVALMEALAAAGSRAEALRVADAHTALLETEFGTAPEPAFRELVDRLRHGSDPSPADPGPDSRSAAPPGPGAASAARDELPRRDELPARAVAVLPFHGVGGSAGTQALADGLHEDLLTELSRIAALTVISRTSVQRYRDGTRRIPKIARELGVGTIVEGSVQRAGGRMRLNVQLIDARTDAHRWVQRYDRDLEAATIFDVQAELAVRIAATLEAELTPAERERVGTEPPRDLEAFRLYAQGRALVDQRTRQAIGRAIDYFQRALDRDRRYALAWSGLADALALLEFYDYPAPTTDVGPLEAARQAVELAPDLGQGHASLGIIHSIRYQGPAALRELGRAVQLAPSYAEAHVWLGWVHLLRGAPEQALAPARRAVELDPLAPAHRVYLAETWLANGEPEAALAEAERARRLQPEYGLARFVEALVLHHLGRADEAEHAARATLDLVPPAGTPSHPEIRALLAAIRAATGDTAGARTILEEIRESGHAFSIGLALAALGETDAALDTFARVADWRSFSTEHFRYFFPRAMGPLRDEARYRELLEQLDSRWEGTRDSDR